MKKKYTLSSAQRKAYLVRGETLLIAIPAPRGDVLDPLAFARDSLHEIEPEDVRAAWEDEIAVDVLSRDVNQPSLRGAIGSILDEAAAAQAYLTIQVAVIVARVEIDRPRHPATRPQWPCDVIVAGHAVLKNWQLKKEKKHE